MNTFRLSQRLFSYIFWDSILTNTEINDGKREQLFSELFKLLVNFHSSKDTSRIDKKGSDKIVVKTLDSLNLSPTFIKIDIEGGEKDFILGAYKTIAKHKPNLAICVYHKPEDFFEIVDKILYINKSYKLYFRHHSLGFTESVMYFMQ